MESNNKNKIVGYLRVSTNKVEQTFDRQEVQLMDAGSEGLFADRILG